MSICQRASKAQLMIWISELKYIKQNCLVYSRKNTSHGKASGIEVSYKYFESKSEEVDSSCLNCLRVSID